MIELGGNITLSGFKDLEKDNMIVVKKLVGNYAKKISETKDKFENLTVYLKTIHETKGSKKFEIKTKAIFEGKPINSEMVERNLFLSLDTALKKLMAEISD